MHPQSQTASKFDPLFTPNNSVYLSLHPTENHPKNQSMGRFLLGIVVLTPKDNKTELRCSADVDWFCVFFRNIGFLTIFKTLALSSFQPLGNCPHPQGKELIRQ